MRPWTYYTLYTAAHLALGGRRDVRPRPRRSASPGRERGWRRWSGWPRGPLLSLVNMWNHFAGAAWMPWAVAAAHPAGAIARRRAARRSWAPRWPRSSWPARRTCRRTPGSSSAAVLLTGVALASGRSDAAGRLVAMAAAALAVTTALSAAQWMPTLAVVRGSPRWAPPDDTRLFWSVHPLGALELLWPELWPRCAPSAQGRALLFDSRESFLASIYVGLPALGLVAGRVRRARRRRLALVAAIGAVAVLAALGRHTPFYGLPGDGGPRPRPLALPGKGPSGRGHGVGRPRRHGMGRLARARTRAVPSRCSRSGAVAAGGVLVAAFFDRLLPWLVTGPPGLHVPLLHALPALLVAALALARAMKPDRARALACAAAAVAAGELADDPPPLESDRPRRPLPASSRGGGGAGVGGRVYVRAPENAAEHLRDSGSALARLPAGWDLPAAAALALAIR